MKKSLICREILRHGAHGFTFPPKEIVIRTLIALKYSSSSAGFEPAKLGSSGKHVNRLTTDAGCNTRKTVCYNLRNSEKTCRNSKKFRAGNYRRICREIIILDLIFPVYTSYVRWRFGELHSGSANSLSLALKSSLGLGLFHNFLPRQSFPVHNLSHHSSYNIKCNNLHRIKLFSFYLKYV
jgi:hypothetical protein